jgi:hypothetical protein
MQLPECNLISDWPEETGDIPMPRPLTECCCSLYTYTVAGTETDRPGVTQTKVIFNIRIILHARIYYFSIDFSRSTTTYCFEVLNFY